MSETITDIGGLRVVLRDDGSASIWDGDPTEGSSAIAITREERLAVALALLGGMSDDLVERCAEAYFNAYWHAEQWHLTPFAEQPESEKAGYRTVARAVLREAFGMTEPTE